MRHLQPDDNELLAYYIPDEEIDARMAQPPGRPLWASVTLPDDFNQDVQQSLDQMHKQINALKTATLAKGIALRLELLVEQFELRPFERDVILLCLAPELDLGYLRLYAYLQDDVNQKYPTIDLMLNLLCPDVETKIACQSMLASTAPLLQHQILHIAPPTGMQSAPALAHLLKLDDRIRRYLLDDDTPDEQLQPYIQLNHEPAAWLDLFLPASLPKRLQQLASRTGPQLFYFQGTYGMGRLKTAVSLATSLNQQLMIVNCQRLQAAPPEQFTSLTQRIVREAGLQAALVYWQNFDVFLQDDNQVQRDIVLAAIARQPSLTILSGKKQWLPGENLIAIPFFYIPFVLPTATERQHLWQQNLNGQGTAVDLQTVASQFRLSGGQIRDAATTAQSLARWRDPKRGKVQTADLFKASRLHSNQKLSTLAQQIRPHYIWTDIILPENQLAQLRQLVDQVKYQARVFEEWGFATKLALGRGVNALFTGQPGTGKTMAADILAGELELDLYKIDLSSVVSKYIGETEKNLARIFAEAETSNAVLFFDEADALFGKRTEVKDSHDRYANLEISYLLQKMDEYEGVVILATNLRENLDDAFVRRIRFIVEFPLPTAADRLHIWQGVWPDQAPLAADIDLPLLAEQLDVAGGIIRNIALAAAFLAAAASGRNGEIASTITMTHLLKATDDEYRKMGRFLPHSLQAKV